jgi:PAS domain-containing protein
MDEIENRAGAPDGVRGSPEEREREAAWRRGEARERARAAGEGSPAGESPRGAHTGQARASVAARAFAALAENVRDYAIFLVDPEGVITFWGEGARLIKWWTKEQAEGGHLRMLYPPGGSNDGTAEAHLGRPPSAASTRARGSASGATARRSGPASRSPRSGTRTAPCSASPRSRAT